MKKYNLYFTLSILILTCPLLSCGQNKSVTKEISSHAKESKSVSKEEYDSIFEAAKASVEKKIRKVTAIDSQYVNNSVVTTTQEFLPPDKSKWLVVDKSGNLVRQTEIIYIGNLEYRKENNSNWVMRNLKSNSEKGNMEFTAKKEESTKEYSIEEIKIDNESFRVLTAKTLNPQKTLFLVYKVWIDKEGLIFKEESKISSGRIDNLLTSTVTNYDYALKDVKIEAPIK